ncbi:MAG: DUF2914 domain-containing protein [Chrysiogenetes bacterium]|nr:DUF2914 domain-containing protein [Chrysiogenetes bacterium]
MKTHITWLALLALVLTLGFGACDSKNKDESAAADVGYTVGDLFVAADIAEKEPVGISEHFFADTEKLYCFSEILGAKEDVVIKHRWFHGAEMVSEVALNIRGSKWRTWSSKTIGPGMTGDWRVQVTSEDGKVLKETSFVIGQ